jgi:hypothetical protein
MPTKAMPADRVAAKIESWFLPYTREQYEIRSAEGIAESAVIICLNTTLPKLNQIAKTGAGLFSQLARRNTKMRAKTP